MFGVLYVAKPSLCSAVACSEIQVGGCSARGNNRGAWGGGACGVRRRGRCAQARAVCAGAVREHVCASCPLNSFVEVEGCNLLSHICEL